MKNLITNIVMIVMRVPSDLGKKLWTDETIMKNLFTNKVMIVMRVPSDLSKKL